MRPTLTGIEQALSEAGGLAAPRDHTARLRELLAREIAHGASELELPRSGYEYPVVVAVSEHHALVPVDPALRGDPERAGERGRALVSGLLHALDEAGAEADLLLGEDLGGLALTHDADPELVAVAFEDHQVDRLRAAILPLPPHVLDPRDLRLPLDRAGADGAPRPHDDPIPTRRVARRILQRLAGMGKWGGYHTEFSHLARGFVGNDRALADAVGEALLAEELLLEKPSVGQRHVYLNPRRAADVYALVDDAISPPGLGL